MGRARRQSGGGRTSGDSNEISLDGMLSASNESRRVSKFSGYRSVFPTGIAAKLKFDVGGVTGMEYPGVRFA